jgi:hypothetical protein
MWEATTYSMTIAFTQYLRPDGRKRSCEIDRPPKVEALAEQFIAVGGRYECEELTTGDVSLTAVYEVDGEDQDVAIELCINGPAVRVFEVTAADRAIDAASSATTRDPRGTFLG